MDLLMEAGRGKSIRRLYFPHGDGVEFDRFEKLAELELELYYLDLNNLTFFRKKPEFWTRISRLLSKLLRSSQKSLEYLDPVSELWFLPQLQFPVLENVKELCLTTQTRNRAKSNSHDGQDNASFLPRGATFARNFPQLKSITLLFLNEIPDVEAASCWKKCFSTDEIIPNVRELCTHQSEPSPDFWLEGFARIFPNLTNFAAYKFKDFATSSQILWTGFKKLTVLDLGIDMASPLNRRPFILDFSFTGISPDKISSLQSLSLATLEQMGGSFGENPSILNLTELKTLNLDFDFERAADKEFGFKFCLNRVTGLCAFNPLKSLQKVHVQHDGLIGRPDMFSIMEQQWKQLEAYKVTMDSP